MVKKSLVHAILQCTVCDKEWQDYLTAQEKATAHARATGHTVKGELGYSVEYSGDRTEE